MARSKIETLVSHWTEEIIEDTDFELVDVEFSREGQGWVLRVYIDKPGGVDIEDCRRISLKLSDLLDEHDPIEQSYSLEVSSPGLERPLKKQEDFCRFSGRLVNVRTYAPVAGHKEFEGNLLGLENGVVRMDIDGEIIEIPYDQVAKARLAVEF